LQTNDLLATDLFDDRKLRPRVKNGVLAHYYQMKALK